MSASVELLEPREARAMPLPKPLDESVWQAWVAENRAQGCRNNAVFLKSVKCLAIAGLLVAAGFWSHLGSFDPVVRSIVAAGAMVAMLHAFHTRQFVLGGLFAALGALYNPVAPGLSFSGEWQRAVVVASTLPFLVSFRLQHCEDRTR